MCSREVFQAPINLTLPLNNKNIFFEIKTYLQYKTISKYCKSNWWLWFLCFGPGFNRIRIELLILTPEFGSGSAKKPDPIPENPDPWKKRPKAVSTSRNLFISYFAHSPISFLVRFLYYLIKTSFKIQIPLVCYGRIRIGVKTGSIRIRNTVGCVWLHFKLTFINNAISHTQNIHKN